MDDHALTPSGLNDGDDRSPAPAGKKPYRKPELVRLGNLHDITLSTGYFGQNDGGRFPRGFRTGN